MCEKTLEEKQEKSCFVDSETASASFYMFNLHQLERCRQVKSHQKMFYHITWEVSRVRPGQ